MMSNAFNHPYRMVYFGCPEDFSQFSGELLRLLDYRLPKIPIKYFRWMGFKTYEKQLVEPFLTWSLLQQFLTDGANQSAATEPWFQTSTDVDTKPLLLFIGSADCIA
jgi:hypothetical protein